MDETCENVEIDYSLQPEIDIVKNDTKSAHVDDNKNVETAKRAHLE